MRVQLDTNSKTIKLESATQLSELVDFLDKILPGEWKNYKLECNVTINWSYPYYGDNIYKDNPFWRDYTIYCGDTAKGMASTTNSLVSTRELSKGDVEYTGHSGLIKGIDDLLDEVRKGKSGTFLIDL